MDVNFDNLVEDAETNDAFELSVIELLGPAALTGGKLNAYEIAKMFWNAALSSAQPTPAQIADLVFCMRQFEFFANAKKCEDWPDFDAEQFMDWCKSRSHFLAEKIRKGEPL